MSADLVISSHSRELDVVDPLDAVVERLSTIWRDVLGRPVGLDEDFFASGGTSIQAAMITNRVQEHLGVMVYPVVIFEAPTIRSLAAWCRVHHPTRCGGVRPAPAVGLSDADVERGRRYFLTHDASPALAIDLEGGRNPPAIFILSAPRSGSTLLRVMLGGHPALFSPPELYLLTFTSLADRRVQLAGRRRFLGEGLARAVMALRGIDHTAAEALIDRLADEGTSTHRLYGYLQAWAGGRRLVDKTPAHALHPVALRRAEAEFEDAFFIHLVRHPIACVSSFAEVRADLATVEPDVSLPATAHARGELWWRVAHDNIVAALREVPASRQVRVRFEELVVEPEAVLRGLCDRLGLELHPEMLRPHADRAVRMTDGTTEHSRMLGDQRFHQHERIEPSVAERWRAAVGEVSLAEPTWALAEAFGYARPDAPAMREEWEI